MKTVGASNFRSPENFLVALAEALEGAGVVEEARRLPVRVSARQRGVGGKAGGSRDARRHTNGQLVLIGNVDARSPPPRCSRNMSSQLLSTCSARITRASATLCSRRQESGLLLCARAKQASATVIRTVSRTTKLTLTAEEEAGADTSSSTHARETSPLQRDPRRITAGGVTASTSYSVGKGDTERAPGVPLSARGLVLFGPSQSSRVAIHRYQPGLSLFT
jgi:hypothetical protein